MNISVNYRIFYHYAVEYIYIYIYIKGDMITQNNNTNNDTDNNDNKLTMIEFTLVSFFNGKSTFVGYLMPKLSLQRNSSGTTLPISRGMKGFILFPGLLVRQRTW